MEPLAGFNQVARVTTNSDQSAHGFEVHGPQGGHVQIDPLLAPGANAPAITAHAVTMPPDSDFREDAEGAPTVVDIRIDERSKAKGAAALAMIRDAIRECSNGGIHPPAPSVRKLARLVEVFSAIALRVPELREYLGWLESKRADSIIARIIGEPVRGRRRESYFYLVELVDRIKQRESCSTAKAARIAAERFGRQVGVDAHTIETRYSQFAPLYREVKGVQYVPGSELLP